MKKQIALIYLSLAAASSHAIVTFSTFGPGDSSKSFGWGFGDLFDARIASQFTPSHTGALDFIKVKTLSSSGTAVGLVSLYRDSGNDIGALMSQFSVNLTSAGVKTLTNSDPSVQLVAGEKYWIEASAPIGSGVYSGWNQNDQSISGLIKFGAVNGNASNPTSTYTVGTGTLTAFSVGVNAVPEPSTMAVMGVFAALAALRRRKAR